jgi:ASC-1-like (ASCH) protein
MKLNSDPFEMICSGTKTIELRLYGEKRRAVSVDDIIIFTNTLDPTISVKTKVVKMHIFDDFKQLYNKLPLEKCGYSSNDTPSYKDMLKYYSQEEQLKYGVVGIELVLL